MKNKLLIIAIAVIFIRPDLLLGQEKQGAGPSKRQISDTREKMAGVPTNPNFRTLKENPDIYVIKLGNPTYFKLGDDLEKRGAACDKIEQTLDKANQSLTEDWQRREQELKDQGDEIDESVKRHDSRHEQEEYEKFKEDARNLVEMQDRCEKLAGRIFGYNAELREKGKKAFIQFAKDEWRTYAAWHNKFVEFIDKMSHSTYGYNHDGANTVMSYAKAASELLKEMDGNIDTYVVVTEEQWLNKGIEVQKSKQ